MPIPRLQPAVVEVHSGQLHILPPNPAVLYRSGVIAVEESQNVKRKEKWAGTAMAGNVGKTLTDRDLFFKKQNHTALHSTLSKQKKKKRELRFKTRNGKSDNHWLA